MLDSSTDIFLSILRHFQEQLFYIAPLGDYFFQYVTSVKLQQPGKINLVHSILQIFFIEHLQTTVFALTV